MGAFFALTVLMCLCFFFFSSRRRHTRYWRDWSSDVCSSDLANATAVGQGATTGVNATAVGQNAFANSASTALGQNSAAGGVNAVAIGTGRSEERRVGKECR